MAAQWTILFRRHLNIQDTAARCPTPKASSRPRVKNENFAGLFPIENNGIEGHAVQSYHGLHLADTLP